MASRVAQPSTVRGANRSGDTILHRSSAEVDSGVGAWTQARWDAFTIDGATYVLNLLGWAPPVFDDDRHALIGAASVSLARRCVPRSERIDYLARLDAMRCVPMLGAREVADLDQRHGGSVQRHEREVAE